MTISDDVDAWDAYPQHRSWFNKLDLALRLGHHCGPAGTSPGRDGWYVVRPIYNLYGMGAGARKVQLDADDWCSLEPGYFWCEAFDGPQHSVTYRWQDGWVPTSSWQGHLADGSLSRFVLWHRSDWAAPLPELFDVLADCGTINVEFVGDHIIEVHLRASPDPDVGELLIPVWADQDDVEPTVTAFDDAGGHLDVPRLGFIVG